MAITIKEIAQKAGVSRGTVDRALNNRGQVSPLVKEKILKIAKEYDYRPNSAGRILSYSKTKSTIGFLLPCVDNPFFDDLIFGINSAISENDSFKIDTNIVKVKGFNEVEHLERIKELVASGVKALGICTTDTKELRTYINSLTIPVVTINTDLTNTKRLCYVGPDYRKIGATAAGMVKLMNRNKDMVILPVSGSLKLKGHNERISGFINNLEYKKAYNIVETNDDANIGYEKVKSILNQNRDINTFFIATAGAEGPLQAIMESKLSNISVLTVDDTPKVKEFLNQGIADCTICQDPFRQGNTATKILINSIIDKSFSHEDVFTNPVITIKQV